MKLSVRLKRYKIYNCFEDMLRGEAAEIAGGSKRTFMELLGNYGASVFNYSLLEIDEDIKNA